MAGIPFSQYSNTQDPIKEASSPTFKPTQTGGIAFSQYSKSSPVEQPEYDPIPEKTLAGKIFDFFTHSTQESGKDIGGLMAVHGSLKQFDDSLESYTKTTNDLIQQIQSKRAKGEDTSALIKALKLQSEGAPKIDDYTPEVLKKSNKQVLGDIAGMGLEALSGGGLSVAKEAVLNKSLTLAQKLIRAGRTGAAYGTAAGVVGGMQADEDLLDIVKSGLKGGTIGTFLGLGVGALGAGASRLLSKKNPITKLTVKSESGETRIPVKTPNSRHAEYAKSQGYEPYTKPTEEIQLGSKTKSSTSEPSISAESDSLPKVFSKKPEYENYIPDDRLPVIQANPEAIIARSKANMLNPVKSKGQYLVEKTRSKFKDVTFEPVKSKPVVNENIPSSKPSPVAVITEKPTTKVVTESAPAVSKVAKTVEKDSIESGITEGFKDLAEYDPITIKDQTNKTSAIIEGDIERAKRIALGDEKVPDGVKPEAMVVAMKQWLKKNPDAEFARRFAKSPLLSDTSAHAQALRILREQDPDSAISAIKEVLDVRQAKSIKRLGASSIKVAKNKVVNEIKKEIKKVVPKKQDWEGFIKSIEC